MTLFVEFIVLVVRVVHIIIHVLQSQVVHAENLLYDARC